VAATDFRILGELEVWQDGRPVPVTGTRRRAVLAILLLHAGEVVSSDRLLDDVWGEDQPAAGMTALRVRISQLRRALGPGGEQLETRPAGYVLRLAPGQLDLRRFEDLVAHGGRALADGDPAAAAPLLDEALGLWRGPPLADFAYAAFAQAPIARLAELRLAAIEMRAEAGLALGRHATLVAELQALVQEHPLRERLCGQLMLALYRCGRQSEALEAYRTAHRRLSEDVGLDPGPELQALERRILDRDPTLQLDPAGPPRATAPAARVVMVLADAGGSAGELAVLAEPLAAEAGHELLIAALVADGGELGAQAARLAAMRSAAAERGIEARVAAFTSADRVADIVRLAAEEDVALLLLAAPATLVRDGVATGELAGVLGAAVCDVALLAGRPGDPGDDDATAPVLVPFGGREHDWAAVELGAWFARATGRPLRLAGAHADPATGRRDASRLLGHASLALQRALGVTAEPLLAAPGPDGIVAAADGAALVVAGLSDRWLREGLGPTRQALAARATAPVLLVRRGLRPGGLAPRRALTRFTWSAG
jgi:DNA-binding SARP family transcriptional activator